MQGKGPKAISVSVRLYFWLLIAYPKDHREEYGRDMAQLFRDQCNDVWKSGGGLGLLALWMRIVPDLLKSSFLEHLDHAKGKTIMTFPNMRSSTPKHAFLVAAAITFALFYTANVIATLWLMPTKYSSFARLEWTQKGPRAEWKWTNEVEGMSFQLQFIQSQAVLDPVIKSLKLDEAFGGELRRYLTPDETRAVLQTRINLHVTKTASVIEIWVNGGDRVRNAEIVNRIAEIYKQARTAEREQVRVIDMAKPGLFPVSPNRPYNLIMGGIFCLAGAAVAGALGAGITARNKRNRLAPPVPKVGTPETR